MAGPKFLKKSVFDREEREREMLLVIQRCDYYNARGKTGAGCQAKKECACLSKEIFYENTMQCGFLSNAQASTAENYASGERR